MKRVVKKYGILPNGNKVLIPQNVAKEITEKTVKVFPLRGVDKETGEKYKKNTFITLNGVIFTTESAESQDTISLLRNAGATYGATAPDYHEPYDDGTLTTLDSKPLRTTPTWTINTTDSEGESISVNIHNSSGTETTQIAELPSGVNIPGVAAGAEVLRTQRIYEGKTDKGKTQEMITDVYYVPKEGGGYEQYEVQTYKVDGKVDEDMSRQRTLASLEKDTPLAKQLDEHGKKRDEIKKDRDEKAKAAKDLEEAKKATDGMEEETEKDKENRQKFNKSEELEEYYKRILNATIVQGANTVGKKTRYGTPDSDGKQTIIGAESDRVEIIDVLNDFGWSYDYFAGGGVRNDNGLADKYGTKSIIPYLYVVEYQQLYSSALTNLVNQFASISATLPRATKAIHSLYTNSGLKDIPVIGTMFNTLGEALGSVASAVANRTEDGEKSEGNTGLKSLDTAKQIKPMLNSIRGFIGNLAAKVDNMYAQSPMGDSLLLNPYKWLYAVRQTGNCYVFPFLSSHAAKYNVTNNWQDASEDSSILNNTLFQTVDKVSALFASAANDLSKVDSFVNDLKNGTDSGLSSSGTLETSIETSKFYKFQTDGQTVEVTFPLYNTIQKNLWRKHYQFIFNFALRNLPFRVDNMSYKVPLLYDLTVPGYCRLPICYVQSFSAVPEGIIHVMSIEDDFVRQYQENAGIASNIAVYVPEAWSITITFKSLVSHTANTVLSALVDTPITVQSN